MWWSLRFTHTTIGLLKVSKNRKQIFQPKLFKKPKTKHQICFSILISSQDRKTNLLVCFSEEVLAGKFAFEIYWPLINPEETMFFNNIKKTGFRSSNGPTLLTLYSKVYTVIKKCDIFVNINLVLQQFDIMTLNFFVFTKKNRKAHMYILAMFYNAVGSFNLHRKEILLL